MNKDKYQEAINCLSRYINENGFDIQSQPPKILGMVLSDNYYKYYEDLKISIDNLQEAINKAALYDEKETPKKVIVDSEIDSADDGDCSIDFEYKVFTCPCCKYELDNESDHINIITNHFKYCFSCGQKLDWE